MPINRQQACDLFKYDFKLVDKEGNTFSIVRLSEGWIDIGNNSLIEYSIGYEEIGKDYHILAHHHSCLTKQLNGVIPIVELAKIAFPENEWFVNLQSREVQCIKYEGDWFRVDDSLNFEAGGYDEPMYKISTQQALFDKLYSLHFLPHGIEESNVKYIND